MNRNNRHGGCALALLSLSAMLTSCRSATIPNPTDTAAAPSVTSATTAAPDTINIQPTIWQTPTDPATAVPPTSASLTDAASVLPKGAVDPNAVEAVDPGDIPDNQAFVPYSPSSGNYEVRVPEGWARSDTPKGVNFTDKYNSITVTEHASTATPTAETVAATGLLDVSSDPTFRIGTVAAVSTTGGGSAIKATYEIGSAANPVTGKKALLAVERYVYVANGHEVVLTLSGAKGADNVDPWKIVTDSVRVR